MTLSDERALKIAAILLAALVILILSNTQLEPVHSDAQATETPACLSTR